jgi:3-methyladenine DNA glycosylase/8-oxoguanine DNA glycosylase
VPDVRTFDVPLPIDLLRSLRPLVASSSDPTIRLRPDRVVRAGRTPDGPATLDIRRVADQRFVADATGPGRAWALEHAPDLLGAADHLDGFDARAHRMVARAHHARRDLRMVRSGRVEDVLVPTILAQRVTSEEAARSWTRLVRAWGQPAPGPIPLRLPPSADELASRPYWDFHRLGVERARAERIAGACRHLDVLQAAIDPARDDGLTVTERLARVPGIGPWTAALVARIAAGDPDTVEVGDYNTKDHVVHALTGRPRGSDEEMLEVLAPFTGHRGRVIRLLLSTAPRPPRFGPRRRVIPVDRL